MTAVSGIGLKERTWRDRTIPVEMDGNTLKLLDFGDSLFAVAGDQSCELSPRIGGAHLGFHGAAGTISLGYTFGVEITSDTAGSNVLGSTGGTRSPPWQATMPHVVKAHRRIPEPHVYADIMHWIDCIMEGAEPVPSGEHARHVIEVIEKAYRSARSGQAQEIGSTF